MGRPSDDSVVTRLVSAVGVGTTQTILDVLGGERHYIPKKFNFQGRDEMIQREFREILDTGQTPMGAYKQLSNDYGLSTRRVREIAKKQPA